MKRRYIVKFEDFDFVEAENGEEAERIFWDRFDNSVHEAKVIDITNK